MHLHKAKIHIMQKHIPVTLHALMTSECFPVGGRDWGEDGVKKEVKKKKSKK